MNTVPSQERCATLQYHGAQNLEETEDRSKEQELSKLTGKLHGEKDAYLFRKSTLSPQDWKGDEQISKPLIILILAR